MAYPVHRIRDFKELLLHAARSFGEEPLFCTDREEISFADFWELVRRAAAGGTRVPKGVVIYSIAQQKLFAIGYFALILTGHTLCLLPDGHPIPDTMVGYPVVTEEDLEQWLMLEPADPSMLQAPEPNAPCTVAFSSGTSAVPKGVVLSQKNLLTDTQLGMMRHRYWLGERLVHMLPYRHLFGLLTDLLAPLHAGVSVFLPASPLHFFHGLRSFRPHSLHIPPSVADALCAAISAAPTPGSVTGGSLEKLMCAGAPLKEETARTLLQHGILPCAAYGLTECSPCVSLTGEEDIRIGSAGPPLDHVSVKLAEDGEILVGGDTVMLGYFQDEAATRDRIREGYLHTGDLGHFDECGHLWIVGRKSSMLVFSNGIKCIPENVESQINAVEGIEESMVSQYKTEIHEIPVVTVVTPLSPEQVRPHIDEIMRERDLYPYQLIVQVRPIPKNAMGKVKRT